MTLDSNVLISYIISKNEESNTKKTFKKSITDDHLMLTDIIYEECMDFCDKLGSKIEEIDVSEKLNEVGYVILLLPVPPTDELKKKYKIRDENDLKILYSADKTKSVILVTMDKDFDDVSGVNAKIMSPREYLNEGRKNKKAKKN